MSTERRSDVEWFFCTPTVQRVQLLCNRSVEERNVGYRFRSTPLARAARTPSPRAPGMNHIHSLLAKGQGSPRGNTYPAPFRTVYTVRHGEVRAAVTGTNKGKCGLATRKGNTQREMAMGKSERAIVLSTPFEPV